MKKLFIYLMIIASTVACSPKQESKAESTAIAFFDAIYNEKDINKAAKLCSPSLAKELKKHITANNAARRLLNLSFDTVKIEAGLGDRKVRQEFNTSGELTILFTGQFNGRTIKELKIVKLTKVNEKWYVDKILKDQSYG